MEYASRNRSTLFSQKENQVLKNKLKLNLNSNRMAFRDISNLHSERTHYKKPIEGKAIKTARVYEDRPPLSKVNPNARLVPKSKPVKTKTVSRPPTLVKKPTTTGSLLTRSKSEGSLQTPQVPLERGNQLLMSPQMDLKDKYNPQAVYEYIKDIFAYHKQNEQKYLPDPNYMSRQKELNFSMRGILLDWLVEVHHRYRLKPETLYLTANIIDRFLSHKQVSRSKLQLVGITALLIASKYEEITYPEVNEFVILSAHAYSRDEILKMERLILSTLKFSITVTSPIVFLRRYLKAADSTDKTNLIAQYLCTLTVVEHKFLQYLPSVIACSAIYLAQKIQGIADCWSPKLEHYSGYCKESLRECCQTLLEVLQNEKKSKLGAVRKIFASSRRMEVSKFVSKQVPLLKL